MNVVNMFSISLIYRGVLLPSVVIPGRLGKHLSAENPPTDQPLMWKSAASAQPTVDGKGDFTLWMTDTHREAVDVCVAKRERIVKAYI